MTASLDDTVLPLAADSVLGLLPARPQLLALGEPTHGADVLLDLRNELFRQLVEAHGFRTIAVESDCLTGAIVDDYITSGDGELDDVLHRGFSHEWGAFAGNRRLVQWMRAHNDGRPESEQVRFAGFDGPLEITGAQSPRRALAALHAYLRSEVEGDLLPCSAETLDGLLGADDRWTEPAAMRDPSQSVGRSPAAQELRLVADDLVALLDAQRPHLVAVSSPAELDRADRHARTAVGLLRYHAAMADASSSRLARLVSARDAMMAGNLLALAEQGPTLASGHNGHFQRARSTMRMGGEPVHWWSAGAIVGARLGTAYAVLATALGTLRSQGVDDPPPDTVEGRLYARPDEQYLVDPHRLAAALGDTPPAARVSPWFGYAPLDPAQLASHDGIVFVKDAGG